MVKDVMCPKCGVHASHIVYPYWDSPYGDKGGLCMRCCLKAQMKFDMVGWPEVPEDKDWGRMPFNCECGGLEFCNTCNGTSIEWSEK